MTKKSLRISLVIPVYNEEKYLAECLQLALSQQLPFYEIIVVDNNSSDDTVAIARSFPGVRVIHEPKQGVVHARNRGFNAAHGDIIARIDADTRLPADWTGQLAEIFTDEAVDAVSGKMLYYDMAAADLVNGIDLFFRRYFARKLGREVALQGANMAMRRNAWRAVQKTICERSNMHEDFDLAIHLNEAGHKVCFDERLVAHIGYRQADSSFKDFCAYAWLSPSTYRQHRLTSQRCMYPVFGLAVVCYGVLHVLHRGYDEQKDGFSLIKALSGQPAYSTRVNPATYVE